MVVNEFGNSFSRVLLQATANREEAFPNPPVIAYRRSASLRDLLVHSTLSRETCSSQKPAGIKKCDHTLPHLLQGDSKVRGHFF